MNGTPTLIICMGVSGSGKSTLAMSLADSFDMTFLEADDFHSEPNKARMAKGQPLTDGDREPWVEKVCIALTSAMVHGVNCVLAHSALRRLHRERLRALGFKTLFLHLDVDHDVLAKRIEGRDNHYMPASLLESQFASLDNTEEEDDVVTVDASSGEAELAYASSKIISKFILRR